jgi:hypothetical protein
VSFFDAVKAVSARGKVLVIVDQLDALASTVDLTSIRLNEILAFLVRCSELPNTSVLCSCRDFEFHYDTRLKGLNATNLHLGLPEWESVAERLNKEGISESEKWPIAFRELLRTPQHLGVFLRHVYDTGDPSPFDSYQAMLGEFWSRAVTSTAERNLVRHLTRMLIDTESLWAPRLHFEDVLPTLDLLQAKGVLVVKDERVGFAHQTLLEYAKARFFTESETSLAAFIFEADRRCAARSPRSRARRCCTWSPLGQVRMA